jgi:hypothetical protein
MTEDSASEIPENIKNAITSRKMKLQKGKLFESAANVVIAYILVLFVMLGYVAITLERAADEELIFLWRYFNPVSWFATEDAVVPFAAFAVTMFLLGYSEKIYPAARFKAIIVTASLITSALLFHQLIHPSSISIALFFGSWEGYVTIHVLVVGALSFSFVGNLSRLYAFSRKKKELEFLKQLVKNDRVSGPDVPVRNDR